MIEEFVLQKNKIIQDIPCKAHTVIKFHKTGFIKECTLSKKHNIDSRIYKKGEKLFFKADGAVN